MISFREINPSDREWITACRDVRRNPFTALSFPSLFSWRKTYGLSIAGGPDFFVIRSAYDRAYYAPCGDPDKCRRLLEDTLRQESGARFLYLTADQAGELRQAGFRTLPRDDLSEYIAERGSLALLPEHHATNSYKMKVRHFQRDVSFSVRPITPENLPLLESIADRDDGDDRGDGEVFRTELDHFALMGMEGCLLETEAGQRAFILGYPDSQDVFTMTMTQHERSLPPQVTAVLMHMLACQLPERFRLINLEEDLGLPGLRQAKMLYSPVDHLHAYEAVR